MSEEISIAAEIAGIKAKIAGMEKAADTIAADVRQVPTGHDRVKTEITALVDEKLKGIQFQIEGVKAAAQKMETSLEDRIRALKTLMQRVTDTREGSDKGRGSQLSSAIAVIIVIFSGITLWSTLYHNQPARIVQQAQP